MKKKLLAGLVSAVLMFAGSISSFAENTTSQTATGDGNSTCTVSATIVSSYSVSLPATLTLSYNEGTGEYENTYTVGVKGVIGDAQFISVVPDASFTIRNSSGVSSGTAVVSQTKTKWKNIASAADEVTINPSSYATTTGSVSVALPDIADSYTGSFTFTYSIESP